MRNKKANILQSVKLCRYLFNRQIKFCWGDEQIKELSGMEWHQPCSPCKRKVSVRLILSNIFVAIMFILARLCVKSGQRQKFWYCWELWAHQGIFLWVSTKVIHKRWVLMRLLAAITPCWWRNVFNMMDSYLGDNYPNRQKYALTLGNINHFNLTAAKEKV